MKKRILAIALSIAMTLSLVPVMSIQAEAAMAEKIMILGKEYSKSTTIELEKGTVTWDAQNAVLTLNNATLIGADFDTDIIAYYGDTDLTLVVNGQNKISTGQYGIYNDDASTIVQGAGSVLFDNNEFAICSNNNCITVSGTQIDLQNAEEGLSARYDITITNQAIIKAKTGEESIFAVRDILINGESTLNIESLGYDALSAYGNIYISGGAKVTATASDEAIEASRNIDISGGAKVTAVASDDAAVYASGDLNILNRSTLNAISTDGNALYIKGDLNMDGESNVTAQSEAQHTIYADDNMTIDGASVVTAFNNGNDFGSAVYVAENDLNIKGQSKLIATSDGYSALCISAGNMYVQDGSLVELSAKDEAYPLFLGYNLSMTNGAKIKATAESSEAIYICDGSLKMNSSTIEATSKGEDKKAIYCKNNITLKDHSQIIAKNNNESAIDCSKGNLTVAGNSVINAENNSNSFATISISNKSLCLDKGSITAYNDGSGNAIKVNESIELNDAYVATLQAGDSVSAISKNLKGNDEVKDFDYSSSKYIQLAQEYGTVASASLEYESATYTGNELTPKVSAVKGSDGDELVEGIEYSVAYANNVNVGTATVTITGKGGYSGSLTKTFVITKAAEKEPEKAVEKAPVLKQAKIKTAKVGKKSVKVTLSKKAASYGGTKFQVRYKVKGKKSWKKVTTASKTVTIKKLKKDKKYQIQARAFTKYNGKNVYGKWSKIVTSKKVK